jgi:hypothetical protein
MGIKTMKKRLASVVIATGLLCGTAAPVPAMVRHRTYAQEVRHRRHMRTAKRVGVGAAGGAAIGAIAGGGKGAGIGALAGAGAGALYDRHKRHHGQ